MLWQNKKAGMSCFSFLFIPHLLSPQSPFLAFLFFLPYSKTHRNAKGAIKKKIWILTIVLKYLPSKQIFKLKKKKNPQLEGILFTQKKLWEILSKNKKTAWAEFCCERNCRYRPLSDLILTICFYNTKVDSQLLGDSKPSTAALKRQEKHQGQ